MPPISPDRQSIRRGSSQGPSIRAWASRGSCHQAGFEPGVLPPSGVRARAIGPRDRPYRSQSGRAGEKRTMCQSEGRKRPPYGWRSNICALLAPRPGPPSLAEPSRRPSHPPFRPIPPESGAQFWFEAGRTRPMPASKCAYSSFVANSPPKRGTGLAHSRCPSGKRHMFRSRPSGRTARPALDRRGRGRLSPYMTSEIPISRGFGRIPRQMTSGEGPLPTPCEEGD